MQHLHLGQFLQAGHDFEAAQYRILDGLQAVRAAFHRSEIYPHLGELITLYQSLHEIAGTMEGLRGALPRTITGVDLEAQRVISEQTPLPEGPLHLVEDLIGWALPLIQAAVEEGRAIFEFVEEQIRLEEVGLVPSYVEEGYLLLPDPRRGATHVLQYTLSIFTNADERYRSLRTAYVRSVPEAPIASPPGEIKLSLIEENRDLPNPATFRVATDLDFPYEPTMLPVAKRKLMQYLTIQGGTA